MIREEGEDAWSAMPPCSWTMDKGGNARPAEAWYVCGDAATERIGDDGRRHGQRRAEGHTRQDVNCVGHTGRAGGADANCARGEWVRAVVPSDVGYRKWHAAEGAGKN